MSSGSFTRLSFNSLKAAALRRELPNPDPSLLALPESKSPSRLFLLDLFSARAEQTFVSFSFCYTTISWGPWLHLGVQGFLHFGFLVF